MRLLRLDLERFGHFGGPRPCPRLELGAAPSLLLVHGNNEAGKTTVLEAIRWLLFGGKGDRWSIEGEASQLAVGARIQLNNGSVMEIRRTKGKGGGLRGADATGADVDEEWILARLSRPNRVVFENVFGFSLDGLAQGAKALEHASLRNVIYGGGLGGTVQPDAILGDLRKEKDALFTDTGRSQHIYVRLKKLEELRARIRASSTRAEEWNHLAQEIEDRRAAAQRSTDAWRARSQELARLRASLDAIEPRRRLEQARAELATLGVPSALPASAGVDHARLLADREARTRELEDQRTALCAAEDTLAATPVNEALLALEDEITAVARDFPGYLDALRDRPVRVEELSVLESRALDRLRALRPSWDLARLRAFQLGVAARVAFDSACAEHDALASAAHRLEGDLRAVAQELRDNARASSALPPALEIGPLRGWLEAGGEVAADRKALSELEARLRTLDKKRQALSGKLDPRADGEVRAPDGSALDRFESELDRLEKQRVRVDEQLDTRATALADARSALARLDASARVPSEEELQALRARRDGLLDELLDGKPTAARIRAHAGAVRDADDAADRMRAHADVVQGRAIALREVERATASLAEAEEAAKTLERARDKHEAAWLAAWTGVAPKPPRAMRKWLEQRDDLHALDEELADCRDRASALRARIAAWEQRGAELLTLAGPADELRAVARERIAAEERRANEARVLDHDRARAEQRQLELFDERDRNATDRAALAARLPAVLTAVGLEVDLPLDAARTLILGLVEARTELVAGETSLRAHLERLEQTLESYNLRAAGLLERCARSGDVEVAIPALERELAAARAAARIRDEALRARERATKRMKETSAALAAVQSALAELYRAASAGNDEELLAALAARARSDALTARIDADERLLAQLGDCDELPDEVEARARALTLAQEVAALEDAMRAEAGSVGEASARFAAIDGRQDAADALAALEAERASLFEEVERYAVLALAERLLKDAIKRFERDNQPAILSRASSVLAAMTAGRFTAIRKSGDGLKVERGDGAEISPEILSTGSREQMYLAIRLAYVEHYCSSAESLPVVLDDVLVNFDDDRARATLAALEAFSATTQVILFTCHQSTIALAKDAGIAAQTLHIPAAS